MIFFIVINYEDYVYIEGKFFDRHNREIDTCTLSRTSAVIIIT
jgi:hypothetical protein